MEKVNLQEYHLNKKHHLHAYNCPNSTLNCRVKTYLTSCKKNRRKLVKSDLITDLLQLFVDF